MDSDPTMPANGEKDSIPSEEIAVKNDNSTDEHAEEEGTTEYLSGVSLAIVLACLCMCELLVALDLTIIATAIPIISADFQAFNDIGWYVSAYFLTNCGFQLVYGKLYSLYKVKPIYMAAVGLFEIGSLICALSKSSDVFIVGRAISGIGAAGIFSGSVICISRIVRPDQRAGYTGMIVGMYGIASAAGPLIGGALTTNVTWRWCFWINLPIGGTALVALLFFLRAPAAPPRAETDTPAPTTIWGRIAVFDPFGAICFFGSIICLLLALQLGDSTYGWSNGRIIALFVLFGVLLIAFIVLQFYGGNNATIPVRVLKQRSMLAGMFYVFCNGAAFFILAYYVPIWFQGVRGDDALQSGIRSLPLLLAQTLFVVSAGIFVSMTGYYMPLAWLSIVLTSVGAGLLTTWTVDTGVGMWIGYQIIFGLGGGLGYQQGITAAQTVLAPEDLAIGTAVMVFVQNLGGTIFNSVANVVLLQRLVRNLATAAPSISGSDIVAAGATGFRKLVSAAELPAVLVAYNDAVTHVFQVALILACITAIGAAGMEWRRAVVAKKDDKTKTDVESK